MSIKHIQHLATGAIALAAMSAFTTMTAQAAPTWAPTATHAHDPGVALHGAALRAAELVSVTVSLELRNEAQLDALTNAIMSGKSNQRITSDDFLAMYAPGEASVKAVVEHLSRNGFTNIEVAPNRLLVTADGSAGTIKSAFNAELHHFTTADGRDAIANVNDAQVPASLHGIVKAVLGLQTIDEPHLMLKQADLIEDAAAPLTAAPHKPEEFPTIYNATGLPAAVNTTIGIIAEGNIARTLTDLATFVKQAGYPTPTATTVTVGRKGSDTSGVTEWDIDSQDALATAGGQVKEMIFYVGTSLSNSALTQAYNAAVAANKAQVINVSIGGCETGAKSSGQETTDDAIFKIAVAQGQTFSFATGDKGSKECGGSVNEQSYPAVSPYVIAVGGTTLNTGTNDVYVSETTWSGGGGGPSTTEPAPAWQISSGVLKGSTFRGVPDISFDADPNTGTQITVGKRFQTWGGTSLASPIFVGFWARIMSAHNNTLVFPASAIYQYGITKPSYLHDVTSGSNGGFTASAGWDYATGFGSMDIGAFSTFVNSHSGF